MNKVEKHNIIVAIICFCVMTVTVFGLIVAINHFKKIEESKTTIILEQKV